MSVDVFGSTLVRAKEIHQGPQDVGFILTKEGDFDIEKRRLCNVAPAIEPSDAVNLENLKILEKNLKIFEENLQIVDDKIRKLSNAVSVVNLLLRQVLQNEKDIGVAPEVLE